MSTVNGLPAHVLLIHFIVVLAPLTAALLILCALWPAARRRLLWLVMGLAVTTALLTPLTTEAGEWLKQRTDPSPLLDAHTELGDTMVYFVVALVAAAALLSSSIFGNIADARSDPLSYGSLLPWSVLRAWQRRFRCTASAIPVRRQPGGRRPPPPLTGNRGGHAESSCGRCRRQPLR